MMTEYSVWNHATRTYDYYQAPGSSHDTSAPKPKHLRGTALGMSPEQAAWPLPSNAKRVGSGKYPKGFIASKNGRALAGMLPIDLNATNIVVLGALGFALYHFVIKKG